MVGVNSYRSLFEMGFVSKAEFIRDISDLRQTYESQFEAAGMLDGVRSTLEVHDALRQKEDVA